MCVTFTDNKVLFPWLVPDAKAQADYDKLCAEVMARQEKTMQELLPMMLWPWMLIGMWFPAAK